jgi:hypothetical protein
MLRWLGVSFIVGLLFVLVSQSALAAERTAVFQSDLTVPVLGTQSIGVLTVIYDEVTGEGAWTYDGTMNGQPANASGRGTSVVSSGSGQSGESSFQLTMTSIESWNMPGFDPDVPRFAVVRSSGGVAYVNYGGPVFSLFAIPVAIDPPLSFPIEGVFVLTNAGSGDDAVEVIPHTGLGPDGGIAARIDTMTRAMIMVLVALLLAVLFLGSSTRPRRPLRVRPDRDVD